MTESQWNTTTDPRAMVQFVKDRRPESFPHLTRGLSKLVNLDTPAVVCDTIRLSVPFPGRVRDVQPS